MLKLIALTSLLLAGLSSGAYAGGTNGDGRVQNLPTTVKGTSSHPVHHYGAPPKCHSITTGTGQVIELCAAQ